MTERQPLPRITCFLRPPWLVATKTSHRLHQPDHQVDLGHLPASGRQLQRFALGLLGVTELREDCVRLVQAHRLVELTTSVTDFSVVGI